MTENTYMQINEFLETLRRSTASGSRVESVAKDARGIDVTLYNDRRKLKKITTVTLNFENGVPVNAISMNGTSTKKVSGMLFSIMPKFRIDENSAAVFIPFSK